MKIALDKDNPDTPKKRSSLAKSRGAMIVLAIVIAALLSAIIYFLFVGPQFDRVGVGKEFDVASVEAQVDAQQETLDRLKELEGNLQDLSDTEIDLVSRILPSQEMIPELLAQLEVIAQTSGGSLTSVNISDVDGSENLSTRQQLQRQLSNNAAAAKTKQTLKTLNVQLSITAANYDSFERFLMAVENHTRIMDVQRFNFGVENQFHSVTVHTYYLES